MHSKFFIRNVIWALVIMLLCSIPGDILPNTSMNRIPHFDKIVHFGMFYIMGIFLCSELRVQTKLKNFQIGIITVGIVALYGGAIELLQHFYFRYRSGDLIDLISDISGGIMAVGMYPWLKKQKDLLINRKPFNKISFLRKIL